jgi:D-aminopeptidase
VIVVLATDAPLDARQLHRLCVRAASGLARTGATIGNGSGEIVLAFSTAQTVPHYPERPVSRRLALHEECLDPLFQATTESVEEAVLNSLFNAETVCGRDGHVRRSILDFGFFIPVE